MNKQLAKSEYLISDNCSGTEITVRLEIDYLQKTFRVKSIRKDNHFTLDNEQQNPDRVISIGNAIRNAAEFAKLELESNKNPE